MSPRDPSEEAYEAVMGKQATLRQVEASRHVWRCCGEAITGDHHVQCRHYVEVPRPIEGQQTLA